MFLIRFQFFHRCMDSCNYFHHIMPLEFIIIVVISNGLAMWCFSSKHSIITHYYPHNVSQEKQSGIILCCFYSWKVVLLLHIASTKTLIIVFSRIFPMFIDVPYHLNLSPYTIQYLHFQHTLFAHQQKSHKCLLTTW